MKPALMVGTVPLGNDAACSGVTNDPSRSDTESAARVCLVCMVDIFLLGDDEAQAGVAVDPAATPVLNSRSESVHDKVHLRGVRDHFVAHQLQVLFVDLAVAVHIDHHIRSSPFHHRHKEL